MGGSIYRESIKQAWKLTWHNKYLWILGLLSVFLGQFGLSDTISFIYRQPQIFSDLAQKHFNLALPNLASTVGLVWIIFILGVLCLFIYIVSAISQGGLIYASAYYYKHGVLPEHSKLWNKGGVHNFWRVLFINILRKLIIGLVLFGLGFVWYRLANLQANIVLLSLVLAVEIFLAMSISAITIYALSYAVVGKDKISRAIKRGFELYKDHLLVSLELSLFLFAFNLILILVVLAAGVFLFIPSIFIWLAASLIGYPDMVIIGTVVGWILFALGITLIGAIFNSFSTSAWVYLFMKMHHESIASRLFHHITKIFKR